MESRCFTTSSKHEWRVWFIKKLEDVIKAGFLLTSTVVLASK